MSDLFRLFTRNPISAATDSLSPGTYPGDCFPDERCVINDKLSYTFNSDKLRSIEFSEKPKIVALGCSITFGTGMPEDQLWHQMIAKKLNTSVGSISYIGGSAMRAISSFFNVVHTYNYKPEIVMALFPSLDRFYFVDKWGTHMADYFSYNLVKKKTKAVAPFKYDDFLPHEWINYINLEYIKMLEQYCSSNGIKFVWTTWSQIDKSNTDKYLEYMFDSFFPDRSSEIFPQVLEDLGPQETIADLNREYSCSIDCHSEFSENDNFNFAYDIGPRNVTHPITKKQYLGMEPHPGLHRHLHWAEMFLEKINQETGQQ